MGKKICGVYKITNVKNGLIYIGSSKNIDQRWKNHKRELNSNTHCNIFMQTDWNKYGKEAFKFEVINETSEENRYLVEQNYLDELKPYYRNKKGYNISECSLRQNADDIKIFTDRYRRRNPFYKASQEQVKMMLSKKDCFGDYIYADYIGKDINTTSYYEWFENVDAAYYISYNGMFGKHHVRKIDSEFIDNTSRNEIFDYVNALDTYDDLAREMRQYGDPDEW